MACHFGKWLFPFVFLVSGCGSIQEGYEIFAFQSDERSAVKDQELETLFFVYGQGIPENANEKLQQLYPMVSGLENEVAQCVRNTAVYGGREIKPLVAGAGVLITAIANEIYKNVKKSISDKAKRIADASQKSGFVRYIYDGKSNEAGKVHQHWRNTKCLLVTRAAKGGGDVGLALLYQKHDYGASSVLVPRVYWARNSVALTKKGTDKEPATIKVDTGIAIHSVSTDIKTGKNTVSEIGAVTLPTGPLEFGKAWNSKCETAASARLCGNASALIADPPANASALTVTVKVVETGTSADAVKLANSANAALDGIAKPVLDEILKQVSAQIGG